MSLGILPAAPVAANTEPDAESPPSVDLPEEAFTQEEDGVGATMTGVFFLLFFSVVWIGVTAVATCNHDHRSRLAARLKEYALSIHTNKHAFN